MDDLPKCPPILTTAAEKLWPYDEYYLGEKDSEKRRNGYGENHWTGAESIEWYTGHFVRDAMNGRGEYRWRYRGNEGTFITYEGYFHVNRMHGYGTMSYPDGRVFTGLFHKNIRWGPGIESHTCLQENVGFWRGTNLIRLSWRPASPSVVLDLLKGHNGKNIVDLFRITLKSNCKVVGETNSALELLKQNGAEPMQATELWPKLYLKHCTDMESQACYTDVFDNDYYNGKIHSLDENTNTPKEFIPSEPEENLSTKNKYDENVLQSKVYFAWNNNPMLVHMMKHCYVHERQRTTTRLKLEYVLSGPRKRFRPAGEHERDCRTLLMASYLGHICNVAQLINENDVHPDIADMQGNTALMYATCGDQSQILHFLVEAGANVNSFNDSCCTPLGVALMRYTCTQREIPPNGMVDALLPSKDAPFNLQKEASDWNIIRNLTADTSKKLGKTISKNLRRESSRKLKLTTPTKKKGDNQEARWSLEQEYDSDESFSEDNRLYWTINEEFIIRVNNEFTGPIATVPYIFQVNDMVQEIEAYVNILKDPKEKHSIKPVSKVLKLSKEAMWQGQGNDEIEEHNFERQKTERLKRMMLTILQLLSDGADPSLVRCPQPALVIAVTTGSSDLVRHLIRYGIDVNEKYPETLDYTALDIAISRPFTSENVEVIRALLESGADVNHRLHYTDVPGPTLLHAVLARHTESDYQDDMTLQVLELLLEHNCNAGVKFKGQTAVDVAMTKRLDLLDTFAKSHKTNLNEIINDANQTILSKMFSLPFFKYTSGFDRLPILTSILLYGADPLIECHDEGNKYKNILEFAKQNLSLLEDDTKIKGKSEASNIKVNNTQKSKKDKPASKSIKTNTDIINDYKQAIDMVIECTRILHIRWLQAKLMKELVSIIHSYKHRPWIMIVKEHKDQKSVGLWLTSQRCIEIWDILKTTKKKVYKDDRILKHLLYIVQFYNKRSKTSPSYPAITSAEKRMIESDVGQLLHEHKVVSKLAEEAEAWKGLYVKPELLFGDCAKFKVCFECALPLEEDAVNCSSCGLVSFCSFACMENNVSRTFCHPCSDYLKDRYFSSSIGNANSAVPNQSL